MTRLRITTATFVVVPTIGLSAGTRLGVTARLGTAAGETAGRALGVFTMSLPVEPLRKGVLTTGIGPLLALALLIPPAVGPEGRFVSGIGAVRMRRSHRVIRHSLTPALRSALPRLTARESDCRARKSKGKSRREV